MLWIIIWVLIAVAMGVGEVLTTDLYLGSISTAAVVALILALFVAPPLQIVAFGAVSLIGIGVIRPVLKRALGLQSSERFTGQLEQRHLEGKRAVVTQTVTGEGGQIRIGQGEFWSARSFDPEDNIAAGAVVEIALVEGVTALVTPVPALTLENSSSVGL